MANRRAINIVQEYFPEVMHVEDADTDIDIEVTNKDSQSAVVRNHKGCAMAVACKRKMKLDGVIISVSTAYLVKDGVATRYKLPESVSREVVSFDRKGGFSSGQYSLKAPAESAKLGAEKISKTGPHHAHKQRLKHHMTEGIRTVLGAKNIS